MPLRTLSLELAEKARELFQEDAEKLQDALQQVRDWLAVQPHLNARTDDQWLAAYIRGCHFDLERVKKKIDLFYTLRHTASEINQMHYRDEKFKELMNSGWYLLLPRLSDPAAQRVYLVRTGVINLLDGGIVTAYAAANIINKIILVDDDNSIISGSIVIVDCKDTDLLHSMALSASEMRKIIVSQTMYFYNDDYEEIYTKHGLSKEIMPAEYGGNGGTLQEITDNWKHKVEEYSEWLDEDRRFGTDETKRPGGPKTTEDMFGGSSFKGGLYQQLFQCFNGK